MADRPIIFSAPMVRALLAGRKTQTRRVVRFPGWAAGLFTDPLKVEVETDAAGRHPDVICEQTGCLAKLPLPYAAGDRLWVREAHAFVGGNDPGLLITRADYPSCVPQGCENIPPESDVRWRPSIHMPRWASRLTLTVTDVRVQRLQDISEADAWAEGVWNCGEKDGGRSLAGEGRDLFRNLWGSLHGDASWDANPGVAALTFTVRRGNIDAAQLEAAHA